MTLPSQETLALCLLAHLDCTQDHVCQQILQVIARTGQPLAPHRLARHLQISREHLAAHLAQISDTEFDKEGNIVGWGITLQPTHHHFQIMESHLYTWCAFDTVLFPSLLQHESHIQSICAASELPISFRVTSEGIHNLNPTTAMLSLILPASRGDCVRETFCQHSHFFQSEQYALAWLSDHPEAVLLSIADAAAVGKVVAESYLVKKHARHI